MSVCKYWENGGCSICGYYCDGNLDLSCKILLDYESKKSKLTGEADGLKEVTLTEADRQIEEALAREEAEAAGRQAEEEENAAAYADAESHAVEEQEE